MVGNDKVKSESKQARFLWRGSRIKKSERVGTRTKRKLGEFLIIVSIEMARQASPPIQPSSWTF